MSRRLPRLIKLTSPVQPVLTFHTSLPRVDFIVNSGEVVSTTVDIVRRNRVLNMLWEHCLTDPAKPIVVQQDGNIFVTLLR